MTYEVRGSVGRGCASFSATRMFDRRDYGLTWNVAFETGGILVSNEVKTNIKAQVVQQG